MFKTQKPHIVRFSNGKYAVRRVSFCGVVSFWGTYNPYTGYSWVSVDKGEGHRLLSAGIFDKLEEAREALASAYVDLDSAVRIEE